MSNINSEDRTLTTRVILVRHGQSTYNVEQRIQGRLDQSVLTEAGRSTAGQVAVALQGIAFDAVYSSPLQRAKETAEIIVAALSAANTAPPVPGVKSIDLLREIDLPLWEGLRRTEVQEKYPEEYRLWKERPHQLCMITPEGEHFPVLALHQQAKQFWQEILSQHQNQTILVVAHNGINRCLISTALGIGPDRYHCIQQSNCGISVLNFAGTLADPVQLESMNLTAHVGQKLPKPRPGHHGPRLLLVRHGETEWNRQQQFQGQIDVPLNDNGRLQAQQARDFLASVQIDSAVSSPLLRPKETAEIILQAHPGVTLQLNQQLQEISHGLWEGKYEWEIEAAFPGMLQQWKTAPETVQMPAGENLQDVWNRTIPAWNGIVKSTPPNTTCLVVGHDAINKAVMCHLFGLGPEHFWNFKQGNGGVTVIDYPDGPDGLPVVEAANITTHLGGILDRTAAGAL